MSVRVGDGVVRAGRGRINAACATNVCGDERS